MDISADILNLEKTKTIGTSLGFSKGLSVELQISVHSHRIYLTNQTGVNRFTLKPSRDNSGIEGKGREQIVKL